MNAITMPSSRAYNVVDHTYDASRESNHYI